MSKKIDVWFFDNDEQEGEYLHDCLKELKIDNKFEIKQITKSVVESMDIIGSPNLIIIDTTSIAGDLLPYGCWDSIYSNLRHFAEQHKSSYFYIVSYVKSWAKDYFDELKEDLGEEIIVEFGSNGANELAHYLNDKRGIL